MAGTLFPTGVNAEVLAVEVSGVDGYVNSPNNLFNGSATDWMGYGWTSESTYVQFTISRAVNIWRRPNVNYLGYQFNKLLIYKQNADSSWQNVTSLYPQTVTNLSEGQWEKTVSNLPAGTYKFTGSTLNANARIDDEWYLESVRMKPSEAGDESSYMVNQANIYSGFVLLDGVNDNDIYGLGGFFQSSTMFVDITVDSTFNFWVLPNPNYLTGYNCRLKLLKWDGASFVDAGLGETSDRPRTLIWGKTLSNIPPGRYKFMLGSPGTPDTGGYPEQRIDGEWYFEKVSSTPPTTSITDSLNWGATGSILGATAGYRYSYVQNPGYTRTGYVSKIIFKCGSSEVPSCKLFIIHSVSKIVTAVSPELPSTGGIVEWPIDKPIDYPFQIGIAPISGRLICFSSSDATQPVNHSTFFHWNLNYTNIVVGTDWSSHDDWGSGYSLASKVTFLAEAPPPADFDGILLDSGETGTKTAVNYGSYTEKLILVDKNVTQLLGEVDEKLTPSSKEAGKLSGQELESLNGGYSSKVLAAIPDNDNIVGYQLNLKIMPAILLDNLIPSFRLSVFDGISIETVTPTSDAQSKFNLTVTPTHQYKNALVQVHAKSKSPMFLLGKFKFSIGDTVIIFPESVFTDVKDISFVVNPASLAKGNNLCRIVYIYPNEEEEYLDFEIFKEEPKRTQVERLFRSYDGGYEGERLNPAYSYAPDVSPCFLVPDGASSTIIKTTDFTSIDLRKYTNIQGVNINAAGALTCVSFDKGLTWKSLVSNVWATVDLSNISTAGMKTELINSITLARWLEVFTPTSLDFAVYIDQRISNYASDVGSSLLYTLIGTTGFTVNYTVPEGYAVTRATYSLSGDTDGSGHSTQLYSYDSAGTRTTVAAASGSNTANGTKTYPDFMDDRPVSFTLTSNSYRVSTRRADLYGKKLTAYLKAINVQITPNLRTGYAFII